MSEGRFSKHSFFYTTTLLRLGKGIHLNYTLKLRLKPTMEKGVLNCTEAEFYENLCWSWTILSHSRLRSPTLQSPS